MEWQLLMLFAQGGDQFWATHSLSAIAGVVAGMMATFMIHGRQIDAILRRLDILEDRCNKLLERLEKRKN